jgi:hypothetical protein
VSRGAAFGDIDNDGAIDIVVANNNGPARLLLNQSRVLNHNHWLVLQLQASHGNRFAIGATVELQQLGRTLRRRAHTDSSYLSSSDVRLHFGLGEDAKVERLMVHWPDGQREVWDQVRADQILPLKQGSGRAVAGRD